MSARHEIATACHLNGFICTTRGQFCDVFIRWEGGERIEIHVGYDQAGRVLAWSTWRNTRTMPPDEAAGRRQRLTDWIDAHGRRER